MNNRKWDKRFFLLFPAALALPYCLYGWGWMIAIGLGYRGSIRPEFNTLGWDWAIFYSVARAWHQGNLAHIYDQIWLRKMLDIPSWQGLKMWMPYPGFSYPPTFLFLLIPFGTVSFAVSYALGQLVTFSGLVLSLRRFATQSRQFWVYATSLLVCPASTNNLVSGQDVFLVAALYVVGFGLLDCQPFLAGAIVGVVSFKPQIGLMVPFAFLGSRNWRALMGAVTSALFILLLSVLIFGPAIWEQWFSLMLYPRHDVAYTGIEWGRIWDDSVFTIATLLGTSKIGATIIQAGATLAAAAIVFFAYRRPMAGDLRFAVFLAASVVAAPHVSQYDMILLACAATIFAWYLLQENARPWAFIIPIAAWLLPCTCPPKAFWIGDAVPLVIFALIAALITYAPTIKRRHVTPNPELGMNAVGG